jgi:hypothetical protein
MWVCVRVYACVRVSLCVRMCVYVCVYMNKSPLLLSRVHVNLRSTEHAQSPHKFSDTIRTGVMHNIFDRLPRAKWVRSLSADTHFQSMPDDPNYTNVSQQAHNFLRNVLALVSDQSQSQTK